MKPENFPEKNCVYAENQPEYLPLPCYRYSDEYGTIVCCWKLSWEERIKLFFTGELWHEILTFKQPLQPQYLTVDKPTMK